MNKYIWMPLAILGFVSLANEEGVAEAQNRDRTGTPDGSNTCTQCHNDGGFSPTMVISLEDMNGEDVTDYLPGETYRVNFDIENFFPIPSLTGFQATVLDTELEDIGEFSNPSNNAQLEEVNTGSIPSRHIVEHSSPSPVGHFEVDWTAPSTGGEVRFYASGIAANGDGDNDGDNTASTILVVPEAEPDGIAELDAQAWIISTLTEGWQIQHPQLDRIDRAVVYNHAGQLVCEYPALTVPYTIMNQHMAQGIYIIHIHKDEHINSFQVLKF